MTLNGRLRSRKKKAFTLIELLVVIAIIALLLSILMPALQAVKEQARTVVCAAHIKQWGVILSFYVADYADKFPCGEGGGRGQWWWLKMRPYFVDQPDILICGKAKIKNIDSPLIPVFGNGRYFPVKREDAWGRDIQDNNHPDYGKWVWSSYGPNAWLMDPYGDDGNQKTFGAPSPAPVPVSSFWGKFINIRTPSRVPFYLDSMQIDAWPHDTDTPTNREYYIGEFDPSAGIVGHMWKFTMLRHNTSVNVVFGDGSVGKTDIKELWELKWHRTFNTTNIYTQPNAPWEPWMK